jgi:hypothetical protein
MSRDDQVTNRRGSLMNYEGPAMVCLDTATK